MNCKRFVIAVNKDAPVRDYQVKNMLNEIEMRFYSKYSSHLKTWKGSTSTFDDFSDDLKTLTQKEPLMVKFLQFLKIEENIQKIHYHFQRKKEKIENLFQGIKKKYGDRKKIRKLLETKKKLEKKLEKE